MRSSSKYTLSAITVLLAMAFVPYAGAQHYVGLRAGYGGGTARVYPPKDMGYVWGLYNGGISWKYYTGEAIAGGLEIDLLFMQQGFTQIGLSNQFGSNGYETIAGLYGGDPEDLTGRYERKVNSIMLPVFWQPHGYLFKRRMRVFLNLGLTLSYNISSEYEVTSDTYGLIAKGDYPLLLTRDNRWGYGLCGGGGFGWTFGRMEVLTEARYYIGYGDILRNVNKYPDNPLRSPMDGLQFSIGVYYRLPTAEQRKERRAVRHGVEFTPLDPGNKAEEGLPTDTDADNVRPMTMGAEESMAPHVGSEDIPAKEDTGTTPR